MLPNPPSTMTSKAISSRVGPADGIEIAPDRHEAGGDADRHETDAHRHCIDACRGQPNQIGCRDVVGDRADLRPDTAAVKEQIKTHADEHRRGKGDG